MAQVATIAPMNQFFALNGSPLNNGKLYFGEEGKDPEQFPISVYWNAAGTVPALQPIRTTSGYPSRSGSPAILYVDSVYSLRVKESNDVQVYYIASAGETPPTSPTPFIDTELVPSYASADSFTLTGDQTVEFQVGRRLELTLGSGKVYGSIVSSVYGALTTVTMDMDSTALDASLSAVALSFLAADPSAIPSTYAKSGANADILAALLMVVGDSRKLRASLTAAGTTITFTADQIIVGESLAGSAKRLDTYSQALNTATTGAGGMDTGAIPTSGFLAVYAIAKADGTKSILGVNATTSSGTIYSGANMPSGYTYSALIAIIPTNATPAMVAGLVLDRKINLQLPKAVFTATTVNTTLASQSISGAVPSAARTVDLIWIDSGSGATTVSVAADATGTGLQNFHTGVDASSRASVGGMVSGYIAYTFKDVPIITAQTIYIASLNGGSASNLYVTGFSF